MRKNKVSEIMKKPSNLRKMIHWSVLVLIGTFGMFLWQTTASMQDSITTNEVGIDHSGGQTTPVENPTTDAPCSSIAYSTTLRFPSAGVTENQLISYDVATPGTLLLDVPVGGLDASISEYLASLDFRPATGQLYGLIVQNNGAASGTIRIVTVNTTTGATTPVGTPITVANPGNFSGFDFNPVTDRIRVTRLISGARDFNIEINPNNAAVVTDTPLAFATGDVNAGDDEFIAGSAYTNNLAGATTTTLYNIDSSQDLLVRQGSVNGTPTSPATGQLFTIGALGVNTSGLVGFDIVSDNANSNNTAYAVLDTVLGTGGLGSPGRLYTVNLTTGAATLVAPIGGLATRYTSSLAIRTCPSNVPVITSAGPTITAESCSTPNNQPDPGETLTVSLPLQNVGGTATTNLTATLQATGGVSNPTPASQSYGALAANSAAVTRTFTFTVPSTFQCGSNVVLTFNLTDGSTNLGTVTRTFTTGVRTVTASQNFDTVTAPALPTGWTNTQLAGTAITWTTSTTTPSSAPNAAFANDPATVNLSALVSPAFNITSADSQLAFKNNFNTEDTFDGMVLEFSTNNGTTWTDIITGGGTFVSGGYTDTLSTGSENPLPGRQAWSGNSNGYIDTVVNLPASLNGQSVRFRWVMGSDNLIAVTAGGVRIDDVQILGARTCQSCTGGPSGCTLQRKNDFNGDGKTDFSVFRFTTGIWYILPNGSTSFTATQFGADGDKLQPFDYDGDGKTDIGVFRNGFWYWIRSSDNAFQGAQFGAATDIPVIGDYVGDNKADLTVYRPSNGIWYTRDGNTGAFSAVQWGGVAGDVPAPGDFDGDCKSDQAVRRTVGFPVGNSTQYFIRRSTAGPASYLFGRTDMQMAIGDYNGDGKSDIGVAETRNGVLNWFALSGDGSSVVVNGAVFGNAGEVAIPGDYDGDGRTDFAVYRQGTSSLFLYRNSTNGTTGFVSFGGLSDNPTARYYQHPLP